MKRRMLLAHAVAVMAGTAVLGADRGPGLPSLPQLPVPGRIGMTDVARLESGELHPMAQSAPCAVSGFALLNCRVAVSACLITRRIQSKSACGVPEVGLCR